MNNLRVVYIVGRLGNQLFHTAFLLHLMRRFRRDDSCYLSFLPYGDNAQEQEFKVVFPRAAPLVLPEAEYEKMSRISRDSFRLVREERFGCFQPVAESYEPVQAFYGCWQCRQYVEENETLLRRIFSFDLSRLNDRSKKCLSQIGETLSVSVHVRRGDYEDDIPVRYVLGRVCTEDYYKDAVERMIKELGGRRITLFVFSDDPGWAKEKLGSILCDRVFVDWNHGIDSWQDMCLMSRCRHHIIPNSTFSWWGAWLDSSPGKKVIAPAVWYNTQTVPDILPRDWIALPVPPLGSPDDYTGLTVVLPFDAANARHRSALKALFRYFAGYSNIRVLPVYGETAAGLTDIPDTCGTEGVVVSAPYSCAAYVNAALPRVDTPYVAVWNADCLVSPLQFEVAWKQVRESEAGMVVPFGWYACGITPEGWADYGEKADYRSISRNSRQLKGEWTEDDPVFFIRKADYMRAGLENDKIHSVRYAARDRAKRMEKYGIARINIPGVLHVLDENFVTCRNEDENLGDLAVFLDTCAGL